MSSTVVDQTVPFPSLRTNQREWAMKRSILPVLVVLLSVLQGCEAAKDYVGLGSGPQPSTLVATISSTPATGTAVSVNGVAQYRCSFPLTLTISGGISGDHIGWQYGTMVLTLKSNGSTNTTTIQSADYTAIFGSSSIPRGTAPMQRTLTVTWSGPFTAQLTTYYLSSNSQTASLSSNNATNTSLTCN